ncbi:TetR/AcrR family transcriptional regulator [Kineococcus sp. NUM-3379]
MPGDRNGPQSASARPARADLAVLGQQPVRAERADAARNRERVLAAAARLFSDRGVDAVTMDDIAAEAGVGKGTLFRRFGDKAGLAVALLDERERDLQGAILSGAPPLGPGAAPALRLHAFLDAYLRHVETNLDVVRLSETAAPGARYRIGSYRFWAVHVAHLLSQARPDVDADAVAHVLLAGTAADVLAGIGPPGLLQHRQAVLAVAAAVAPYRC